MASKSLFITFFFTKTSRGVTLGNQMTFSGKTEEMMVLSCGSAFSIFVDLNGFFRMNLLTSNSYLETKLREYKDLQNRVMYHTLLLLM